MPGSHRVVFVIIALLTSGCAYQQVSYREDIAPVLEAKCNHCHQAPDGYGYRTTGLKLDSYEHLMKGSIYGPVVISGDSRRSTLNKLIEGRVGKMQQKLHNTREELTQKQRETFKYWVDQGALDN